MAKRRKTIRWRASWKGQLQFGLVSFPVQAVNARSQDQGDVHFHQLHAPCHSRIRYEKVCPLHGEVENDEIVSGYEYTRGKYVEVDPEELNELRTEKERALTIDSFIKPEEIDPIYFDGRMYYLIPDGAESQEPYKVLAGALEHQERWGVGHVVMSGKDQIVLIRPRDNVLIMAMLNYAAEIRSAKELKAVAAEKVSPRKMKLAEDLVKSWSDKRFDFKRYEDRYRNRLAELIDAKGAGREVVTPEEEEESPVINLMDALKQSVAKARSRTGGGRSPSRRPSAKSKPRRRKAS
jgi:DNA end-binding protein Ku